MLLPMAAYDAFPNPLFLASQGFGAFSAVLGFVF